MEYTNLMLFVCGFGGILIHNLVKIGKINKATGGNFKFAPFMRLEWPSISLSLCVVIVCLIAKQEIKQLEQASKYLALFFVFSGYAAQSLVYSVLGKAEKKLKAEDDSQ